MSERLVVDSIMTADGEVVPLGPVDKDGHRVPLDTTDLYGPRGSITRSSPSCTSRSWTVGSWSARSPMT